MPELSTQVAGLFALIARIGIVMAVIAITYYAYWRFHPSNLDR